MTAAARARARKLLALTALAAALAAWGADRARSGRADACVSATSGHARVGAITRILHTSVYVRGRYTGTAPCDLVAGDDVKTDSRGEAVLRLSVAGRETTCAVFQLATLGVYPSSRTPSPSSRTPVVSFSAGRTWCSRKGRSIESVYTAGNAQLLTRAAAFGVEVDRGTVLVKVASGTMRVQGREATVLMRQSQAVLVSSAGRITGPVQARFDAKDGLALARLR